LHLTAERTMNQQLKSEYPWQDTGRHF